MGHSGKVGMPENLSQFGRQSNLEVAWCERQRHNNQISVVIEPGASLIHARIRASLAGLDEGTFTEGHELDRKTAKQVPKAMIGRRLAKFGLSARRVSVGCTKAVMLALRSS
jgi:hypothetical protein